MNAAIVGAGIGGLAAAIRLRAAGHDVVVFEKNQRAGGKLAEIRCGGFRFDSGPSLFTLPESVEELFSLFGEDMADSIPYRRLDVNCKYFFPDSTDFTFFHDHRMLEDELEAKGMKSPQSVFRRMRQAEEIYDLGAPVFLYTDFHKLSNFNTPPYRRVATKLYKLDFFRTMHRANAADFGDERLVRIFDRYATYNGSNPYRAPATLNMIAHLENNLGAAFPTRGMYSIAEGLYELALRHGVIFRFNTLVKEISVRNNKVVGIRTQDEFHAFDTVVCDADVSYAAANLLRDHPLRGRLRRSEPSSSALIFYWGIDRQYPQLDLHNIFFSNDYRKEFGDIFTRRTVPADPTVYLFISSRIVPGDAPSGQENWFAMVNSPAASGQNWDDMVASTREAILRRLEAALGEEVRSHIVCERIVTPHTIQRDTLSMGGALYGTSSNSMTAAFMRHPNSLRRYGNLYFVGGSVHPGGGIPLCVASAGIVCDKIAAKNA